MCGYRCGRSIQPRQEQGEQDTEAIDAEFTEAESPENENLTDLEIARQELERANNLLIKCLRDLPDGSSIVICEYRRWVEWMEQYANENPDKAGEREYLLKPGYHYLYDCLTNRTMQGMGFLNAGAGADRGAAKPAGQRAGMSKRKKVDTGKILVLHRANWSNVKIAEERGISDVTVGKYLKQMKEERQDEGKDKVQ